MSTTTTNITTATQQSIHLSEQQNFVKKHDGLDATPGYVVVVFERLERGGARFEKIVNSDERFKRFFPFWSSPQKYFAVAVNQSVLRYTFEAPVTLDDDIRQFTLIFHLTYRAANPRILAELHGQDPLRLLTKMITEAISRSCKPRKWEMVKERFRELERLVLDSERGKIIQYAETLGIQIISLELDRRLQEVDKDVEKTRIITDTEKEKLKIAHEFDCAKDELLKAQQLEVARSTAHVEHHKAQLDHDLIKIKEAQRRERERETQFADLDQEYDVESRKLEKQVGLQDQIDELHRRDQTRKLNEVKNRAIGNTFENVAANINTPDGLLDAFGAVQQMSNALREDDGSSATAALSSAARLGLPAKEETLTSLLISDLGEITRWNYPDAQQRALRSAILHIIAEALLDAQADNAVLQQYADKLNELGSDLHPPLTQTQFHLLETYRDTEALRRRLG